MYQHETEEDIKREYSRRLAGRGVVCRLISTGAWSMTCTQLHHPSNELSTGAPTALTCMMHYVHVPSGGTYIPSFATHGYHPSPVLTGRDGSLL